MASKLFVWTAALLLFAWSHPAMAQEQTIKSTITTTSASNGWAVNYPKERKVFCMAGLVWVFYSDGANGVFRTSADGVSWSEPALFATGGHFGHRFGCWFDGTYFHYALCTSALGADVFYRRGTPGHDGAIAWSAPEQTAYDTPANMNIMYPKIVVDSNGCPWISFMQLIYQVPNTPPYDAIVIKASSGDGTWATAAGFPFTLVHKPVEGYPDPVAAPLSNGKMLWFYNTYGNSQYVYAARPWLAGMWGAEEIVVNPGSPYSFFNIVADGDDVHVVHGAGTIFYQKRTWGSGWSQPLMIDASASGHTSITRAGRGNVLVTWLDISNNSVRYRELAGGIWSPAVTLADESIDHFSDPGNGININTLVNSSGRFKHAVVYSTGSAAPYKLKFAGIALPQANAGLWIED